MKTFKCLLPIDLAFIMPMRCSEHSTQLETIFFSEDFLVVIHQYFAFVYIQIKAYTTFTRVNPFLFLLPFIIFIVLLPFGMNFKSNFGLNFYTIVFFHLKCKISFGFLPIKEKSLGLLELASKM